MKHIENTKKEIQKFDIELNSEKDQKILTDLLNQIKPVGDIQSFRPNIWRIIMKKRVTQFTAAAIVLIAAILTVTVLPNQSAYAQAVKELRKARTLTYTLVRQNDQQSDQTTIIEVAHKAPSLVRTTTVDGYISILDDTQGKLICLLPDVYMCFKAEYKNLPPQAASQDPFEIIQRMKTLPSRADKKLGKKEIDGVLAEGYVIIEEDVILLIWIDSETRELVQVDHQYPSSPRMNFTMRDIQLDTELDDSIFLFQNASDYQHCTELSVDIAQITEKDFINFFQTWIEMTYNNTFPPMLWGPPPMLWTSEFGKVVVDLEYRGEFTQSWTDEEVQTVYQGNMFLAKIPSSDWRYMGQNIPFGDPEKPVFWYRPQGGDTYRVIYADLSVKDIAPKDLPK